ncbi:DEAD/DEAH box helicase [Cohnella sp. LGH]|uniref:DEAD/DEAH box helicase n=1 Tax=Cohnella sp. LGH TaxID=1619153 RepID=UPI001ADBCE22|nr:DEAD/DEAH box helicase [Cohnella sp. LGH]QTH39912.1 DEAD/DEAH box helicase [Cohnella sp. LGH]
MDFVTLGLNETLVDKLAASGITQPSEVQRQALPELLSGRDGILISPTGTGKTLAYLLPMLQRIDGSSKEVQALILAPTQELAMQIMREAEAYGQSLGVKAAALIGGASLARQLERMKSKPALIVGTPGRVREVASTRKLSLHRIGFVVVDETDRIFSLGGKNDVENLLKMCSRERQTVFVSATRSQAMREAEAKWQSNPWVTDVTEQENENGLSSTLKHWYFLGDRRDKIDLVQKLVRHLKPSSALLFVNDTDKIGELIAKLRYEGLSVEALYGDTRGQERGEVMQRFRKGRTKLLIATDVAARGLDLPGLPLVIQLEPALDADHYVHRSGRTARMGRDGTSITLIAPEERFILDKLEKQLSIVFEPQMLYEGRVVPYEEGMKRKGPGAGRRSPAADERGDRPLWKSKADYLASLETRKQAESKGTPSGEARRERPQTAGAGGKSAGKMAEKSVGKSNSKSPVASKPQSTAQAAPSPAAKPKPGKSKSERAREQKNKGAPKWLKAKREAGSPPKSD